MSIGSLLSHSSLCHTSQLHDRNGSTIPGCKELAPAIELSERTLAGVMMESHVQACTRRCARVLPSSSPAVQTNGVHEKPGKLKIQLDAWPSDRTARRGFEDEKI